MTERTKLLIALTALLTLCGTSRATDTLSVKLYFRQNEARLDRDYRNNALLLDSFTDAVKGIMADPTCRIEDIYIRSGASPEGGFQHNLSLSLNRGRELRDYLQGILLLPDDKFVIDAVGEDWQSLRTAVERNNVPDKEKILDILDRHADFVNGRPTVNIGSPKMELMDLSYGRTWNWLLENIYPDLRSAGNSVVCRYTREVSPAPQPQPGHIIDTVVVIHEYVPDSTAVRAMAAEAGEQAYYAGEGRRPRRPRSAPTYRFAVRTNLLFDAVLSPNIGLEFPIGKRVSVLANHNFPWYTWDSDRFAYQLMNTSVEARLWLGDRSKRSVLTGGYLGLYGASGKGDLEYQSKGYQVPRTWHAGLTAGWSFPLGKLDNWRFDLGVGLGFLPYRYDYYERSETSGLLIYKNSNDGRWIGPTNVRCSIVWMLPMNSRSAEEKAAKAQARQDRKAKSAKPAKATKAAKNTKNTNRTNNAE